MRSPGALLTHLTTEQTVAMKDNNKCFSVIAYIKVPIAISVSIALCLLCLTSHWPMAMK